MARKLRKENKYIEFEVFIVLYITLTAAYRKSSGWPIPANMAPMECFDWKHFLRRQDLLFVR